ncbi:hypothetical protein [Sphingomonas sp. 3-13AW]|uniref:hypothetical protein n=1 Tax=Sphingomonas sp. 3-13AW TaxID=3050450 RepID=UPI003BB7D136
MRRHQIFIGMAVTTGIATLAAAASVLTSDTLEPGLIKAPSSSPLEARTSAQQSAPASTGQSLGVAAAAPILALSDSEINTFHDSETMKCGTEKVHIDGPVRVFEDQFNVIHMTVSDPDAKGWQWTGSVTGFTNWPDKTAALDCSPVMIGNVGNNNQSQFDQKTWIQALYFNAGTIYGYGHGDYFGTRTSEAGCHQGGTSDGLPNCWYSSIPVWTAQPISSANRHLSFSKIAGAPNHVAIYPHAQYPGHSNTPAAGWIGYGTPSNIVRGRNQDGTLDGYWYMYAYSNSTPAYGGQSKGVCLFRSADPSNKSSWRAWNGSTSAPAFTQTMGNPYTTTNQPCAPVQPALFNTYVRSVVWHKPSKHYIAIFRDSTSVRYATSTDLLTWSAAQTLLTSSSSDAVYPVTIDFDGGDYGDDNFDRMYDNGKTFLFYRKSVAYGHTRITRRRINVTNYAADVPGSGNPG